MDKILVTGGLGFIGSHTVVELQNSGYEVIIIDDLSNSSFDVLHRISTITGITPKFEQIDLKNKAKVTNFFKSNNDLKGVIHFAASKAVGESTEQPLMYYENNINTLVYILQELEKSNHANFIFSSSCTGSLVLMVAVLCHTSTGNLTLPFVPEIVSYSITTGMATLSRLSIVTIAPFLALLFWYSTLVIAWSNLQFSRNIPFQNQPRSSPTLLSMLLKKSHGEGCWLADGHGFHVFSVSYVII